MSFKALANLDEMKLMAGGRPEKMAEYATRKAQFEQIKTNYFNEDFPFVNGFDEHHLESLKQYAEANLEDEAAQVRYALQKERFAVQEKNKGAHHERKALTSDLRQKLVSGEQLSNADLQTAEKLARQNPSPDNLVMYSTIKQTLSEGADE
jgi:hypothetical protein